MNTSMPENPPPVPAPAAVEPRRLCMATLLFADARGLSALAQRTSPETAAARLDAILACFIQAVYAEGGAITDFVGDGALAVFGAPLPHAEPAAAAARAALRARAAVDSLNAGKAGGASPRFGFGINAGLVMAGCFGDAESGVYGVRGAPVTIAARLEEAAGPGRILVGGAAAALLDGRFVLSAERALRLAGIGSAVRASELIG